MRRPLLLVLLTSLVIAPAVQAGTVYVPVTKDDVQGKQYKTKIWVTNTGSTARNFTTLFLAADADGTKRAGVVPTGLTVPAGGTLLLTNLGPAGKAGMIEVSGAPQLVVTARLDSAAIGGPNASSAHLPVISSDSLVAGEETVYLQGLARVPSGVLSSIGIVNLAHVVSQCSVQAFRSNGTQIGGTAIVSVQPLSLREFTDAYAILQETQIADSYFSVSCPEDFSAYATVIDPTSTQTVFVTPSGSLASTLTPPGELPAGTVHYTVPGVFLDAKPGDSAKSFNLPVNPTTRYKKAVIEFDLKSGPMTLGPRNFYGITAFRRNDKTLYFGLIVRDDRDKTILDMGVDDDVVLGSNGGPWKANSNYYVIFAYDTETRNLNFQLFRAGVLVEQLNGRINHTDLIANDRILRVDFGQTGIADGAYFPPHGWKYSNLSVRMEP